MKIPENNDPSKWLTKKRVTEYLSRIDIIPHRREGEHVLSDLISKRTKRILDLGSGNGRLIKILKEKIQHTEFVAIDFSPHMLAELDKQFHNEISVKIIKHDMSFPLPDEVGKFDAIVSSFVIHHLTNQRKKKLYSEIFVLLKSGGIFCNLDHVYSDSGHLNRYFRKKMGHKVINKEHNKRLTRLDVQLKWLSDIGFTDVDCYWKWMEFALMVGYKPYI